MKTTTPQAIIDAARPHRERARPKECTNARKCWVIDPYASINMQGSAPRCNVCGGFIKEMIYGIPATRWHKRASPMEEPEQPIQRVHDVGGRHPQS